MEEHEHWDSIRDARAVVIHSLWHENSPMLISEAYALGQPVIAWRTGGIPEMVENGATGFLVAPGDPYAMAGALQRLLHKPEQARTTIMAGRRLLYEQFSPRAHYSALREVYAKALNGRTSNDG